MSKAQNVIVSKKDAEEMAILIHSYAKSILEERGYKVGRMAFGYGDSWDVKLTATKVEINQDGIDVGGKDARVFINSAHFHGLDASHLGKAFSFAGRTWKIVGMKKRGANPFICEREGKKYLLPVEIVPFVIGGSK